MNFKKLIFLRLNNNNFNKKNKIKKQKLRYYLKNE